MPAKGKTKGHTMEKSTTQNPQAGGHSSDKFVGGASSHPNVVDNGMNFRFPMPVLPPQQCSPTYMNPMPPPLPQTYPHYNNSMPPNTQATQYGQNETMVALQGQSMMFDFMQQINQRMITIQESVSVLNVMQKDMSHIHKKCF